MGGIFSFIASIFGYVLNFIYGVVNNYGVAIIIFSIFLKLLLLPISIKQQKTMKKTAKIQSKVKEIQDKYKNDPNKMNQEVMSLYKSENVSPLGGCLPALFQILFLIAMFVLVRNPITYMLKANPETINNVKNFIVENEEKINQAYPEISVLKYVSKHKDEIIVINSEKNNVDEIEKSENENEKEINNSNEKTDNKIELKNLYINMNFLGLDLSNIPQENWSDWTVFVIPVLYVITSVLSMKISTKLTNKQNKKDEIIEIKEDESKEKNENKKDDLSPEEMTEQMNKSMTWFLPIMSVSISLVAPLGLALYWLVNNILMIVERIVLNNVFKDEEVKNNE